MRGCDQRIPTRWSVNGEVPVDKEGALVGDLDRVGEEIESRAMARCKQYRSKWARRDILK